MRDFCNERPFTAIFIGLAVMAGIQFATSEDFTLGVMAAGLVFSFYQTLRDS